MQMIAQRRKAVLACGDWLPLWLATDAKAATSRRTPKKSANTETENGSDAETALLPLGR